MTKEERGVLLCHRSAAYASLGKWTEALKDADEAVEASPDYAEAYERQGKANASLKAYEKAAAAYAKGMALALKHMADSEEKHAAALEAQAKIQAKDYDRLCQENKDLKQQLDDYHLMFDKAKRG